MIFQASQRSGGQNLATHLMRTDENEHVRVHEVRGFIGETVHEAFKEAEAISRATRCRQYLFSISMNPPGSEQVADAEFERIADHIEKKLGLEGQPRVMVFHTKENRSHAHVVWSRIDAESMTARPLPFTKNRLMEISRELYLEKGWDMPEGMQKQGARDPQKFSRAEWEQAKRLGQDPRWISQIAQSAWKSSDNGKAFRHGMEERGLYLAKGDKRGIVAVDFLGGVHSLPRLLGLKTKEVRNRLDEVEALAPVADVQAQIADRTTPAIRKHIDAQRKAFEQKARPLGDAKAEMTQEHRDARRVLEKRQADERLQETAKGLSRLPRGLRGLWDRLTGRYREIKRENEGAAKQLEDRQRIERETLTEAQRVERRALQIKIEGLRKGQAEALLQLRSDLGRYLKLARTAAPMRDRDASRSRIRTWENDG